MNEAVGTKGEITIELRGPDGELKDSRKIENLITAEGFAHIASRVIGTAQATMGWMAVGTDNTAAALADTALGAELTRVATTVTNVTTTNANDTVRSVAVFNPGVGTGALVEMGLFNAASAGTMLNRAVFAVINKGALDTLTLTWDVKFS